MESDPASLTCLVHFGRLVIAPRFSLIENSERLEIADVGTGVQERFDEAIRVYEHG